MIFAAIVAGGSGTRMGAGIPKQFLDLCGKPIIIRTVEAFLANKRIDLIYVGIHADWIEYMEEKCREFSLPSDRIKLVKGGADRNSTVFKIIDRIKEERMISEEDIILTHDGVRPFVSQRIIDDNINAMNETDGVTTAIASTDTLLYSENGGRIDSVPDRSKLFRAQTPQTFRLKKLCEAYDAIDDERKNLLTDTASVFTFAGLPVGIIKGEESNLKLTTPFDMTVGEAFVQKNGQ